MLTVYQLAAGSLTMFGVMTILLAAIGIYGLVAYTVQQSTQEIGIRMAVGAGRGDVVWTFGRALGTGGDQPRRNGLAELAGTWSAEEQSEFDAAVAPLTRVGATVLSSPPPE